MHTRKMFYIIRKAINRLSFKKAMYIKYIVETTNNKPTNESCNRKNELINMNGKFIRKMKMAN